MIIYVLFASLRDHCRLSLSYLGSQDKLTERHLYVAEFQCIGLRTFDEVRAVLKRRYGMGATVLMYSKRCVRRQRRRQVDRASDRAVCASHSPY